ncbi:MAG: hypothetical protein II407_04500 [Prevotella sp.]|jgi:hypothetical protein|nr:hypothetical protein [Prevotella sp.]
MKRTIPIIVSLFFCLALHAQEDVLKELPGRLPDLSAPALTDSISLLPAEPEQWRLAPPPMWGMYNWQLHEGLNVSLGASVFAEFGKHAHKGAGFTQNISALYLKPLSEKLALSIGGYFNNVYWMHESYRDAGLSAVLSYRFNDHWEAYVYGQKSLINQSHLPLPLYFLPTMSGVGTGLGDKIGAAVRYNFNQYISVEVALEHHWINYPYDNHFNRYRYPVR